MITKEQRQALRESVAKFMTPSMQAMVGDLSHEPGNMVLAVPRLLDALDEMERERNRLSSRVFELEHFKGDAERRTKEDIARRLLGAVGRVAGMEIDPEADAVEWTVNKLAGLNEELRRLRLELAAQQEESRELRAQQHLDAGSVRVPPPSTFDERDAEIERADRSAVLLDVLPQHQIPTHDRDAPARVLASLTRKAAS